MSNDEIIKKLVQNNANIVRILLKFGKNIAKIVQIVKME